jgi:glycosyltransferase involved in cell wall biosynthesis
MKKPLRIFVNALHSKAGGGLTYLRAMLPHLAAHPGIELHLGLHESQRRDFEPIDSRIRLHVFSFKDGFARRLLWEQIILPWHVWRTSDLCFSPANFGPLLAPRPMVLLRNALDVSSQDARMAKKAYWKALGLMTWLSLALAPRALAVSAYASGKMGSCFGKKIAVVPHGVDHACFHPAASPRGNFLLAVGDITVQKNYRRLIEVVERLPGVELRIAGQPVDEACADELGRLIEEKGLRERVSLLGRVDRERLADLYRRCRLFVFPSSVETFGNPLVEAMASGCPIACSNAAAMPEVLGDAGLTFDPFSTEEIERSLKRLLEDAPLRAVLSARALDRAKSFFWELTAEQTMRQISQAAQAAPSPWSQRLAWLWVAGILIFYFAQFGVLLQPILRSLGLA